MPTYRHDTLIDVAVQVYYNRRDMLTQELFCSIGVDWLKDKGLIVEWEQWETEDGGTTLVVAERSSSLPVTVTFLSGGAVQSVDLCVPQWAVALREDRYVDKLVAPARPRRRKVLSRP